MKCSGLAGNESQEEAPTLDPGPSFPGDGDKEKSFLKAESNWLKIRLEGKDDESKLG